jgi:hypothetical protein
MLLLWVERSNEREGGKRDNFRVKLFSADKLGIIVDATGVSAQNPAAAFA